MLCAISVCRAIITKHGYDSNTLYPLCHKSLLLESLRERVEPSRQGSQQHSPLWNRHVTVQEETSDGWFWKNPKPQPVLIFLRDRQRQNPPSTPPQLQKIVCCANQCPFLGTSRKPSAHKMPNPTTRLDLTQHRLHPLPPLLVQRPPSLRHQRTFHPLSQCEVLR